MSNRFKNSPDERALKDHPLLARMRTEGLDSGQTEVVLGQWYHPLHYFPAFLSRHIAVADGIEAKTHVSKILWQELGEGEPDQAHESIYISTMTDVGFSRERFVDVEPLPATRALIDGFRQGGDRLETSLGYLFATEAADLVMVGAIGAAVRSATGRARLPWVDIHVKQEPDHTSSVELALAGGLNADQWQEVERAAVEMFGLWRNFFTDIGAAVELAAPTATARTAEPVAG